MIIYSLYNRREKIMLAHQPQTAEPITSMKGDMKKKATWFKPNHANFAKHVREPDALPGPSTADDGIMPTQRMDIDTYNLVTTSTSDGLGVTATDTDGNRAPIRILRPKRRNTSTAPETTNVNDADQNDNDNCEAEGNRTIDIGKMVDMWNDVIAQHTKSEKACPLPTFAIAKEKKWGQLGLMP